MSDLHPEDSAALKTGVLYVVATPIGHMQDITLRALSILSQVDLIAAEDTRHTGRLLKTHGIEKRLVSCHEHNEARRTAELVTLLREGARVALVSDAGTPTVSDPGYRLVQEALAQAIPVVPIPGAAAAVAALSVSGLPTDAFTFFGFPARRKEKRLQELAVAAQLPHTLIFYQSPQRLNAFLEELLAVMGDREAVLAREITKLHEEFIRARLSGMIKRLGERDAIKGECTILVAGAADAPPPAGPAALESELAAALKQPQRPLKQIARELAERHRVSRRTVYALALKMKGGESE